MRARINARTLASLRLVHDELCQTRDSLRAEIESLNAELDKVVTSISGIEATMDLAGDVRRSGAVRAKSAGRQRRVAGPSAEAAVASEALQEPVGERPPLREQYQGMTLTASLRAAANTMRRPASIREFARAVYQAESDAHVDAVYNGVFQALSQLVRRQELQRVRRGSYAPPSAASTDDKAPAAEES